MRCPKCGTEIPDDSAFCPECGSSIEHAARHCPWCGAPLREGATFCSSCGNRVDAAPAAPVAPAPSPSATVRQPAVQPSVPSVGSSASQTVPKPKKKHRGVLVAGICAAVVVAGGVGLWWYGNHAERQVSIKVEAPNYSNDATRIPLHVTGADADGKSVDKTVYVDADGGGLSLSPGTYEATVEASPILADGSIYQVPEDPVTISVPSSGPIETLASVPETIQNNGGGADSADDSGAVIQLTPTDPAYVTDEQIAAAVDAASKDPNDNGKAQTLSQTATAKRDEALAALVGNTPSGYANTGWGTSDGTYDYFYSNSLGGIYRSKNDGSSPELLVEKEIGFEYTSYDYGLNVSGDTLYYVKYHSSGKGAGASICSVGTDGSNPQELYATSDADTMGWHYDSTNGTCAITQLYLYGQKLYYILDYNTQRGDNPRQTIELWSMDEDGSNQQKLSSFTADGAEDIPVFVDRDRLYYAANTQSKSGDSFKYSTALISMNLDGSDSKQLGSYQDTGVQSLLVQDGKLYACVRDLSSSSYRLNIVSMDEDGSNAATLCQSSNTLELRSGFAVVDGRTYAIGLSSSADSDSFTPLLVMVGSDGNVTTADLQTKRTIPSAICPSGDHLIVFGGGNGRGAPDSVATFNLDGVAQNAYAN